MEKILNKTEIEKKIAENDRKIVECDKVIAEIFQQIEKNPLEFKNFVLRLKLDKKLWGKYPEVKKFSQSDTFFYELTEDYMIKVKEWNKNQDKETKFPLPDFDDFIKKSLDERLQKEKEQKHIISEQEAERFIMGKGRGISPEKDDGKKGDFIEENPFLVTKKYEWDSEKEKLITNSGSEVRPVSSLSPEERKLYYQRVAFYKNLRKDIEKGENPEFVKTLFLANTEPVSKAFERFIKELKNYKNLYQLAKEKGVDRRKLHRTLENICFPIKRLKNRRKEDLINLSLFNLDFPLIQVIWREEKIYKDWLKLLKSNNIKRPTDFIKYKIKSKKVPSYYFYVVPPSIKLLSLLKNRNKEPINFPKGIWEKKYLTPKEIKELMKNRYYKNKL